MRITLFWLKAMCLRGTVLTKEELVWYAKRPEYNDRAYRVAEDEFNIFLGVLRANDKNRGRASNYFGGFAGKQ